MKTEILNRIAMNIASGDKETTMTSMRLPEHRPRRVRGVENTNCPQVPTPHYAFTKEAKIEYIKPVTTDLAVLFKLTEKTIEDYKNGLEKIKKHEEWLTVEGCNEEKELSVRTELLMYLRTWPRMEKDENRG